MQAAATRDVDMQVTFTGGLEGLSERLAARKKDKNATVWDKYLQHQRYALQQESPSMQVNAMLQDCSARLQGLKHC